MTDDITALVERLRGMIGDNPTPANIYARAVAALTAAQARMADSEQQCTLELGAMKARLAEVETERDEPELQRRSKELEAVVFAQNVALRQAEAERDAAQARIAEVEKERDGWERSCIVWEKTAEREGREANHQARDCGDAQRRLAEVENQLVMKRAEAEGIGSLLLDVQQDCIVATKRLGEVEKENLHLRAALANSKDPCIYCQLPADEMAKCRSGFPGCSRMDDISGCPEFGAMMNEHHLLEKIAEVEKENDRLVNAVIPELLGRFEKVEKERDAYAEAMNWPDTLLPARIREVEKERDAAREDRVWLQDHLKAALEERDAAREAAHYANGVADLAMKHRDQAETERDAARERIEDLGEMAGVCVGRYLGRRCSYCQCDGKNLEEVQGKVKLGSNSETGGGIKPLSQMSWAEMRQAYPRDEEGE